MRKIHQHTCHDGVTITVHRVTETNEYRVRQSDNHNADYFTSSKEDALGTAWLMFSVKQPAVI